MERWTHDQSVAIRQLIRDRHDEAHAERLARAAKDREAGQLRATGAFRQRVGRRLIAIGEAIASEPRPVAAHPQRNHRARIEGRI